MKKKYSTAEFQEKYQTLFDGPKTINLGKINVMYDVFELFIKDKISKEIFNTGIILEELYEDSLDVVLHKYCK